MKIEQISSRATAYTYDEIDDYITIVILIECENRAFLIDTFCGSEGMTPILKRIHDDLPGKQVIVVNTHAHWDHMWGNCSFKHHDIIGHELCRSHMDQTWEEQIRLNGTYLMGDVEKCLPNLTFRDKMTFQEEGIEIFHSPGHTKDSISVFDHREKTLYAGDNLEKPIIYVNDANIAAYIETLKRYLDYKPEKIIAGHTLYITKEEVLETIHYLESLMAGKTIEFETPYMKKIHQENLEMVARRSGKDE